MSVPLAQTGAARNEALDSAEAALGAAKQDLMELHERFNQWGDEFNLGTRGFYNAKPFIESAWRNIGFAEQALSSN